MTAAQKIEKIKELQALETPWKVKRFFGALSINGDQICLANDGFSDFGTLEELQQAAAWIVEQLGGTCNFTKPALKKDKTIVGGKK